MLDKNLPHLLRVTADYYDAASDKLRFLELMDILKEYPCGISEIALFTNGVHTPFTLAEGKRRAEIIKERLAIIRENGFKAGINHLTTIGHHEEDLPYSLGDKYQYMVGETGQVCKGSYCMNDTRYLNEYVAPLYKILAETKPDFILVDDDIRYGHMPIGAGCFCDICINKFNKENGFGFTRESLVEKLNGGDINLRKLWLNKQSSAIENILKLIGDTVRSVNENIILGFMTGERYIEGYKFDKWAEALSGGGKYEIMWRPGGGAYTDYRFDEIVEKAEQTGRQNAYLPSCVTKSHYEIENFPYQLVKKTPTSTALEAAWAMTSACTGAAFNILPWESKEPLSVIKPHFKAINKLMPLYKLLSEKTAGKKSVGIITAWKQDIQAAVPVGSFANAWGGMYSDFAKELFDLGFPEAYCPENSVLTLMNGESGKCYSDSELTKLLSKAVLMDAGALEYLHGRGFANLTGFKKGEKIPADATESYCEHPLNKGIAGGKRNCRQAFNMGDSFEIIPVNEKAECVCKLIDYHDKILAECSMGVFENEKCGRIAAAGYYPFSWISDFNKFTEYKRLVRYLSGNSIPSYVESLIRIRNHSFVEGEKVTVALLNPTNENYEEVIIAVRGNKEKALIYYQDGKYDEAARESFDGYYSLFKISKLPSFEITLIEA